MRVIQTFFALLFFLGIGMLMYGAWISIPQRSTFVYVQPTTLDCRLPDVDTEYRIIIQSRDVPDQLLQTCSIEPRLADEGRRKTLERLLRRKQHAQ